MCTFAKKMKEKTFSPSELKAVAGCFPTGVIVVSIQLPNGETLGMTASSFLSVSLSPPLVLFSVVKENRLAQHLKEEMPLGISILSEEMEAVSNHFARITPLDDPPAFTMIEGAPILNKCHAWYATVIHKIIAAGDHYLVLCAVQALQSFPNEKPLVYYRGYTKLPFT